MDNLVDLRMRGSAAVDVASLPGTIHPFGGSNKSLIQIFLRELATVLSHKQAKKIVAYAVCNFCVTVILLLWCNGTDSMALSAYTYLTIFDMFRLITCLVTLWVQQQKPTPIFSFGYERFEVLAVFASTILAQLGALFIMKESIERMLVQPEIHTGRLLVGTALAFIFHLMVTYGMDNKAFNHIVSASSSSWLQEHVADMSESLCHIVPGLSKLLLPRINPFALIAAAGGIANIVTYILIDMNNYYSADTWAAVWIAVMTVGTMFPMSVYSGKILLQTTPSHMIGQLDKCIREASTLDGVLEFRHEHFWTLAFGTMGGSVHVRVRRDADEQLVLAHVVNRLSNLISVLTVQIFKDDWTRTSAYQIIGDTSLLNKVSTPANSPARSPVGLGSHQPALWPGVTTTGGTGLNPAAGPGGFPPGFPPMGAAMGQGLSSSSHHHPHHPHHHHPHHHHPHPHNISMNALNPGPSAFSPVFNASGFSMGGVSGVQQSPYSPTGRAAFSNGGSGSSIPTPLLPTSSISPGASMVNPLSAGGFSKLSTSSANNFISDTLGSKTRTLDSTKENSKQH